MLAAQSKKNSLRLEPYSLLVLLKSSTKTSVCLRSSRWADVQFFTEKMMAAHPDTCSPNMIIRLWFCQMPFKALLILLKYLSFQKYLVHTFKSIEWLLMGCCHHYIHLDYENIDLRILKSWDTVSWNDVALKDLWTGFTDVCPNADVMEKASPTALASLSMPKILP